MASSNSKPTQILLPIFIIFFLFLLNKVNSLDDLSFTFKKFVPNQLNLIFQGDASALSTGALRLTKVQNDTPIYLSIGRALYLSPVNIWDSTTGKVASFTTSFSFVMKAPNPKNIADGLAFFLAPHDSQIPPNSLGPYLGLFSNDSSNQIAVGVEFDTFVNDWDPRSRHIGIDVNSIKSKNTVAWDWRNGEVAMVVINYVASTNTLIVSLTYPSDQTSYAVSASVDLKAILPEWVRVGFSATTGLMKDIDETHEVLSWSFTSTWKKDIKHTTIENNVDVISQYNA